MIPIYTELNDKKAPDQSREPSSPAGGTFNRNPSSLSDSNAKVAPQPDEQAQPDFLTDDLLHFNIKDSRIKVRKEGYFPIKENELRKLNLIAPSLQKTAQFYVENLSGTTINYVYKDGIGYSNMAVRFEDENFMHLTGIMPYVQDEFRTASQTLYDFATGKGEFEHILVSSAFKDKLTVLPLIPEIVDSKSFILDDLSEVEKFKRLQLDKAIKTEDEDLLLAFRDVDGIGMPASVIKLKPNSNLKSQISEKVEDKTILGVFRERNGVIETLSVNDDLVHDNGQEIKIILESTQATIHEQAIKKTAEPPKFKAQLALEEVKRQLKLPEDYYVGTLGDGKSFWLAQRLEGRAFHGADEVTLVETYNDGDTWQFAGNEWDVGVVEKVRDILEGNGWDIGVGEKAREILGVKEVDKPKGNSKQFNLRDFLEKPQQGSSEKQEGLENGVKEPAAEIKADETASQQEKKRPPLNFKEIEKTSILDVARSLGMEFEKQGTSGKYYNWIEHDSFVINTEKNKFDWFSKDIHGNVINLVKEIKDIPEYDAAYFIKNGEFPKFEYVEKPKEPFVYKLGQYEDKSFSKGRQYLKNERGLSDDTIDFFISQGVLVQSMRSTNVKDVPSIQGDWYKDPVIVFKSLDPSGKIIGTSMVGIDDNHAIYNLDKEPIKHKQIGWNSDGLAGMSVSIGKPKRLVIAEAPIDLMSYYELHKNSLKDVQLVALDGVKKDTVSRYLADLMTEGRYSEKGDFKNVHLFIDTVAKTTEVFKNNPNLITLVVDNDKAGRDFVQKFKKSEVPVLLDPPPLHDEQIKNDWNDELKIRKGLLPVISKANPVSPDNFLVAKENFDFGTVKTLADNHLITEDKYKTVDFVHDMKQGFRFATENGELVPSRDTAKTKSLNSIIFTENPVDLISYYELSQKFATNNNVMFQAFHGFKASDFEQTIQDFKTMTGDNPAQIVFAINTDEYSKVAAKEIQELPIFKNNPDFKVFTNFPKQTQNWADELRHLKTQPNLPQNAKTERGR